MANVIHDDEYQGLIVRFAGVLEGAAAVDAIQQLLSEIECGQREKIRNLRWILFDYRDVAAADLKDSDSAYQQVQRSRMLTRLTNIGRVGFLDDLVVIRLLEQESPSTPSILDRFRRTLPKSDESTIVFDRAEALSRLKLPLDYSHF
ncbi:MAG: hypothetical protein JJ934_01930 [Pseudomonadales bacterium]|nr:hypothetical protein [Pseudomonadales bacterium]MBO6655620.1 hypothetical protein [Pseudomonadales bacterium]MBO6700947.1 hypothetical protein [Pseudomonadales bacterium]MBO7005973.1 hypothetical protein [Pseudomonadales bacterium]